MGVAFVTVVVVLMSALVHSMWEGIRRNGSPDNVVLLSKKAQNAIFSSIKEEEMERLVDLAHVRESDLGFLYISPEILTGATVRVPGHSGRKKAIFRGVDPSDGLAYLVNDSVRLTRFRADLYGETIDFSMDQDGSVTLAVSGESSLTLSSASQEAFRKEHADAYAIYVAGAAPERDGQIVVGRLAYIKLGVLPDALAVGKSIWFGETQFRIIGTFDSPGCSLESEIWIHLEDLKVYLNRRTLSQITLKADKPENVAAIIAQVRSREDVKLNAVAETAFYAAYSENFNIFRSLILVIGVILAAGGVFAGTNTMYAAVMGRIREIGTLKVLGFPPSSIFFAIVAESVLIAMVGGILGSAAAYTLSLGLSGAAGLGIPIKISMNAFLVSVSLTDVLWGFGAAFLIGVAGALAPAFRGVRMSIVDALRWV